MASYAKSAADMKAVDLLFNIIPDSVVGAFAKGDILQILLFSILFGFSLMALRERGHAVRGFMSTISPRRCSA